MDFILEWSKKISQTMFISVKKMLPDLLKRQLHRMGILKRFRPAVGNVVLGDLKRTEPLSKESGFDRGGPIDRYYIETFLGKEADCIRGRVLEIADNSYTLKFGGSKVTQSDILHVDDSNPSATVVADLGHAPHLPDDTYDCLVITQTLQYIYEFRGALKTCRRILKPGGVLLVTVPGISPVDIGWSRSSNEQADWFCSFSVIGMKKMMAEAFPSDSMDIGHYGNILSATAFLYGMGRKELEKGQLDTRDAKYPVIITVKATKTEPES